MARIRIKSNSDAWHDTASPVVVSMSVHSEIYTNPFADLKMAALFGYVRSNTRGRRTILFGEFAHVNARVLEFGKSPTATKLECLQDAQLLAKRLDHHFQDFEVSYWSESLDDHQHYASAQKATFELYQRDVSLQELFRIDAENTYTAKRQSVCPDKKAWIDAAVADYLDYAARLQTMSKLGWRAEFYPGRREDSVDALLKHLLPPDEYIHRVNLRMKVLSK